MATIRIEDKDFEAKRVFIHWGVLKQLYYFYFQFGCKYCGCKGSVLEDG